MKTAARFSIDYSAFLDFDGNLLEPLPECCPDAASTVGLYQAMNLVRSFDSKAVALQRTGRLGTYASSLGQEAIGVAVGRAMDKTDVLLPSYREHGAQIQRGVGLDELLLYWGGDERGSAFRNQPYDFPNCVPIATQMTHAAGVASAFMLRREPRVAIACCGDGGTSKGDFYEALNLAGAWTLPMVFVVSNNQWAISVPRSAQTAAETLAQKAIAGGIRGEQVDGNDVIAVLNALHLALERARNGGGATLVECLTYRMSDHTTADDASRYRPANELEQNRERDPLRRTRRFLEREGVWDESAEKALLADCSKQVDAAAEKYLASEPAPPECLFENLYAVLPHSLKKQRQALLERNESDA